MRAFRLGITGKMGSGKSTLSNVFRDAGITILDADTIAKDVMQNDEKVRAELVSMLGDAAYENGDLNKALVAQKIFSNPVLKMRVEAVVHPATLEFILNEFSKAKAGKIVALESAILYQTGLDSIFDAILLVDAEDDVIVGRLSQGGKFTEEDIRRRLAMQAYDDGMKEDAELVVTNNTTYEGFISRCKMALEVIRISALQKLPEVELRNYFEKNVGKGG